MHTPNVQSRIEILRHVPLFGSFNHRELATLAELFVAVSYRRGDTVCVEGEPGDTFFVCVSGELEVWGGSPRRVINRLGPGQVLGEMSLLVGGRRAATVTVARNAQLLGLNRAAFERHFLQNAKVLAHFSKILTKRLSTMARGEAVTRATTIVAVTATPGLRGTTLVARSLAALLGDVSGRGVVHVVLRGPSAAKDGALELAPAADASLENTVRHLRDGSPGAPTLSIALPDQDAAGDDLNRLIEKLTAQFPLLVLEADGKAPLAAAVAVGIADVVVRIVDQPAAGPRAGGEGAPRVFEVVNLYNATSSLVPISHCEPFVLRNDPAIRDLEPAAQTTHIRDFPWSGIAPPLHRLARKILGATVGIALGGGAAFGIAHIGVLKVLEDNAIPVDMVAGCSMGSIVALGYAAGFRSPKMIDLALEMGTMRTLLSAVLDFTLTRPGLLSGDKVARILGPLAGDVQNFEQLTLPCRVVAADIETGERVALSSGPTVIAGKASCSIPMLVAPVRHQGHVLVDGGIVDPVPAEVVHEMGADICLAVNVVPHLKKGVETVLSTWYRRFKRLDPLSHLAGSQDMPNMFDIIMNSMQALQHELGAFKAISADVRINTDLSGLTWIEFHKPQEFIERGAEAAERALPEIKRVLAARLAPPSTGAEDSPAADADFEALGA